MHTHALRLRPTTTPGRWSLILALGFLVLQALWVFLPGGALLAFLSGVAGGVVALIAILRRGERGLTVYLAILPLLAVIGFVLAELLIGHD